MPVINHLNKKERFNLAHSFRDFSPWLLGLGACGKEHIVVGSM
jgi:hypothetical protein